MPPRAVEPGHRIGVAFVGPGTNGRLSRPAGAVAKKGMIPDGPCAQLVADGNSTALLLEAVMATG